MNTQYSFPKHVRFFHNTTLIFKILRTSSGKLVAVQRASRNKNWTKDTAGSSKNSNLKNMERYSMRTLTDPVQPRNRFAIYAQSFYIAERVNSSNTVALRYSRYTFGAHIKEQLKRRLNGWNNNGLSMLFFFFNLRCSWGIVVVFRCATKIIIILSHIILSIIHIYLLSLAIKQITQKPSTRSVIKTVSFDSYENYMLLKFTP